MPGDVLVQAAPAIAALVGVAVLCLTVPRCRHAFARRDAPEAPATPEVHLLARELVTEAARVGYVDRWGVRVHRVGVGWLVNGGRYPSARQAEAAIRSVLRRGGR